MAAPRPLSPGTLPDDRVVVGVVVGAHGTDGQVRVHPDSDNPQRFGPGARLIVGDRELAVERARRTPDGQIVLELDGVRTREDALVLRNETVYVPASDVPRLPPDTYYHYQLLDMTVVDEAGRELGTLTEIVSTGANDVYVVTSGAAELLLPAVDGVVLSVDLPKRRMTAAVPAGLEWRELRPPKAKPRRRPRSPHTGG